MVVPPIPLLLPSPEEKKPPAKRIEGILCYLPKCQNIYNQLLQTRTCCLMQHVGPLVASRLNCLSKLFALMKCVRQVIKTLKIIRQTKCNA